jgi:hypothetical protein
VLVRLAYKYAVSLSLVLALGRKSTRTFDSEEIVLTLGTGHNVDDCRFCLLRNGSVKFEEEARKRP